MVSGEVPIVPLVRGVGDDGGWTQGEPLELDGRSRLCRCGRTSSPPFCDDDHEGVAWGAIDRLIAVPRPVSWDQPSSSPCIAMKPNGPLRVRGVGLEADDATTFEPADRYSLCCCGRSNTPPFCDGSHKEVRG